MSSDELEYLALASTSPADERLTLLQATFPEVFRQGKIDFDALRRSLGEWVEPGQERFGLSWPGKAECMRVIQEPSIGTLTPMPKESIDWDTTQNVIIEGENLEVLKLLQKAYYGKIKIIYIDPPYNTGKEFIYPDNFREGLTDYLRYSGQVDEEGFKLSANAETDGRYHSKWLSMMYPRLFLARNLLREDGVIFVSIDDHEVHNLRMLMNEIFGEENFVAELVWEKTRKNDARLFSVGHDYMLVFARSLEKLRTDATIWREPKPGAAEIVAKYRVLRAEHGANDAAVQQALREWYRSLPDGHPSKKLSRYKWVDARGPWRDRDISWPGGGGPRYEIVHPETGEPCTIPEAGWRFASADVMREQIKMGLVAFREDHTQPPFRKAYLMQSEIGGSNDDGEAEDWDGEDTDSGAGMQVMPSVLYRQSQVSVRYLRDLLGEKVFTNPKDHEVLQRLVQYVTGSQRDALILDFFAGSGSTGEAVVRANAADGGSRSYVLVQLPEPIEHANYGSIADITRERIRRMASRVRQESASTLQPDIGFRSFRLTPSNFRIWDAEVTEDRAVEQQLELAIDHVRDNATDESILTELLLKTGYALTSQVEDTSFAGIDGYAVADGALLVCLSGGLTMEAFEAMVERDPAMILVLDAGFGDNDELKVNALQTVRAWNQREGTDIALRVV